MKTLQKKRVLIFSLTYFPRFVGGAEIAVKEITQRLENDFEFDMITLRCDSVLPLHERIGNVNIYRVGLSQRNISLGALGRFPWYFIKVLYPILAARMALRLHREKKYDLLWSIMTYMGLPAAFVKWRNPTLKFILTLQDGDSMAHIMRRLRIRPIAPLIRKMFRSADSVQSISSFLSTFAIAMGHDKTTNVIPNGVTVDIFQKRNIEREIGLKRKLNILEHEKIVVTTSRLVEKNGIDDLIASLAHLPADFRLLVVGEGPLEDALRALVSRLKLEERVIFAGFVPHADLPTYLHVSNVFSRPSHSEGMGISFIEAMAAGIPVVTTAVGGIPDFLKDQETGLFVEVKNPTDIANKIQLLLNDEKLRTHIVEEARLMVQRKYDWNIVSHAMEQLFMRVIS